MKKIILGIALCATPVVVGATTVDCSGSIQNVVTSAVITAQEVVSVANTVVADAQVAWPIVYALIPASAQPAAQTAYNNAVLTANSAIMALADAIQAAQAVSQTDPNFTAAIQAVSNAIAQIIAIVNQYTGTTPAVDGGAPPPPPSTSVALGKNIPAVTQLNNDLVVFKRVAHSQ
jgi:hypothetical protein